jgi:predicted dehydrogenase
MSYVKMAVVGVGALGRHHARILHEMPGVELVAVVDSDPQRGQEVASKTGTRYVADYRELFGKIDAASIVVPTVAHGTVASEFLSRGIPLHIEKPLAETVATAESLVELADRQGVTLQVGHIERFNPAWRAAAPHCAAPKYIRSERFSPFSFRSTDIGVVLDVMVHDLDLILSLVRSPVRNVEAFGVEFMGGHEDAVQARVTFENGCVADLTANRVNPEFRRAMQVWSTDGCVSIDFQSRSVTRMSRGAALQAGPSPTALSLQPGANVAALKDRVFTDFLPVQKVDVPPGDALTAELASFANCVRSGLKPLVGGHEALAAITLAEQILQATRRAEEHPAQRGPAPMRRAA